MPRALALASIRPVTQHLVAILNDTPGADTALTVKEIAEAASSEQDAC